MSEFKININTHLNHSNEYYNEYFNYLQKSVRIIPDVLILLKQLEIFPKKYQNQKQTINDYYNNYQGIDLDKGFIYKEYH